MPIYGIAVLLISTGQNSGFSRVSSLLNVLGDLPLVMPHSKFKQTVSFSLFTKNSKSKSPSMPKSNSQILQANLIRDIASISVIDHY